MKNYAYSGQLTVQLQDATGEPFFAGAEVKLFNRSIDARETLSVISDANGWARFTALPTGTYLMEIAAPGYHTVQQQVIITGTQKAQALVVSLIPAAVAAKVKIGAVTVAPKAFKETDKALGDLEGNRLEEAQEHLARALAIDHDYADGNYLMGIVLLREKDAARARAYFQRALELSPEHTAALLALGEAEYLEHDYTRATESLEKFLRAEPNSAQAPAATKYVDAMRKMLAAAENSGTGSAAAGADGTIPGGNQPPNSGVSAAVGDLPEPTALDPTTESSWAPPDVDDEKIDLDTGRACPLDQVVKAAGHRMQELVANVNRFTATESLEHINLSPMGVEMSRESRQYKYVAEIRPVGSSDVAVEEYRTGSKGDFPEGIETVGLSSLALVFHPNLAKRYKFRCDGDGSWSGHEAWVVHFQQPQDQNDGLLTYRVGSRAVSVGLRGRAWIDAKSMQILAMESDIVRPLPEIQLKRDHQLIEYGPVNFRKDGTQLWLPKSADWYCSISGKHFHRRHTFSQFLLFSVDDKQKISTPTVDPE
jgi:tetratricopeptide (TPR) repeat protein